MKLVKKWKSLSENRRFWIIAATFILVLGILPRVNLPDPIPYPKQYPLKKGSYNKGMKAYKEGKYGLALANFIYSAKHQSDVRAMSMASNMYDYGQGVNHDICQGTYWSDWAARNGSAIDQERLSQAYYYSFGLERDNEKAYLWAKAAVANKIKAIKWYEEATGVKVKHPPEEWLKYLHTSLEKKDIAAYDAKYSSWNYKRTSPVNILRIHRLPYIGMSPDITECDHSKDDPSIYTRF